MSVPSATNPSRKTPCPDLGSGDPGEEACEQVDFELVEAPGQDDFDLLVLADIHLANRLGDIAQYKELMLPEVKNYIAAFAEKGLHHERRRHDLRPLLEFEQVQPGRLHQHAQGLRPSRP